MNSSIAFFASLYLSDNLMAYFNIAKYNFTFADKHTRISIFRFADNLLNIRNKQT